ncbi:DUF4129 domain-containing protein [Nocardioides marinquilinus]|uniref:DUF4129 domain-containing protein n=1 Tax=Nocardioides marinquilinus TaxID=1210400 RepID=A0ABP9Q114_9ACTN
MTPPVALLVLAADPPLDPTPDEARDLLRRELAKPEYYTDNVVQRLLDWLGRQIDGTVNGTRDVPAPIWFLVTVVVLGLAAGIAYLASQARTTARRQKDAAGDVLDDRAVTADELRAAAERALAEGRWSDAVVEAYRALARRQVERGRLDDDPGVTAHEVARLLAREFPPLGSRTAAGADLFDAVMYGERQATRDQATSVLDLDRELAGAR